MILRPGLWNDVCALPDGRFAWAVNEGGAVVVLVDGREVWRTPMPGGAAIDLDCAADRNGEVRVLAKGADDQAYRITRHGAEPIGPAAGKRAVAIEWDGAQFVEYVVRNGRTYTRNGEIKPVDTPTGDTAGGFNDVVNGEVRWGDTWFSRRVAGVTFAQVVERGGVLIGQCEPNDQIGGVVNGQLFTAIDSRQTGHCFEPRIAQAGHRYAICARTQQGAGYVEVPPFPAFLTAPVIPPPPPVDPVEPDKPMPTPPEPDKVKARKIVEDERAKFGPMDRSQLAQLMRNIARALNAAGLAGGPFGVLEKSGGNNCDGISCDVIGAGNGPSQRQWDVIGSSDPGEAQTPMWHEVPRHKIKVRPLIVPDGPVEPPPDGDVEALKRQLAAAHDRIAALEAHRLELSETATRFWQELGETRGQVTQLQIQRDEIAAERDALRAELEALKAQPEPRCEVTGPAWARRVFGISCKVVR